MLPALLYPGRPSQRFYFRNLFENSGGMSAYYRPESFLVLQIKSCVVRVFILLLILFFQSAVVYAQVKVVTQGHRGARGLMPENTIAAMKKSMDLGIQVLEMDAVISADKQVVVSHDVYFSSESSLKPSGDTVSQAEEKSLLLYKLPYAEIRRYDVGSKHNRLFPRQVNLKAYKPLLAELIDSVDAYAKEKNLPLPGFNIEIKSQPQSDDIAHPKPKEFVDLVLAVCRRKNIVSRMCIQSFDLRPLSLIHELDPQIKLSFLTSNAKTAEQNLAELGFLPAYYSPNYKTVNAETIRVCHEKGIKVIPWTVNTKSEIDALVKLGADGIISDYPDLF